jgi:hypothetical protein
MDTLTITRPELALLVLWAVVVIATRVVCLLVRWRCGVPLGSVALMNAPVKCASCARIIERGKVFVRHTLRGDAWVETLLCFRCADVSPTGGAHAS